MNLSFLFSVLLFSLVSGCSNLVLVKKETCKEVYGGALLECEQVKRSSK